MLSLLNKAKKPVILAIGGSTFKEVKIAVKKLRKKYSKFGNNGWISEFSYKNN